MKLEISLFKFDYKSDYLPYYTKHFINMDESQTLQDIFKLINEEHPISYIDSPDEYIVVNEIYTKMSTSCKEIRDSFGSELTFEPLSIRRANKDFLINEDDFNSRLEILNEFINDNDKTDYQSNKIYFYASNTLNFEYDYIGDSLLLLASNLVSKNPENEKAIIKKILDYDCSVDYHTNLSNRILNFDSSVEEKIEKLIQKCGISTKELSTNKKINFGEFKNSDSIKHNFKDFVIAYYEGTKSCNETATLLEKLDAKKLKLNSLKQDLGKKNEKFTYKIASKIMLDAFDSGADLLIVDNDEDFYLLDANRKNLYNACGREITIPVLHKNELEKLAIGEHEVVKSMLASHLVNPEII